MSKYIDLIIGTLTVSEEIIELEKALTKYLPELKPGGHIAITTTPQIYDYVGMALRLQNIEIRDMIMWLSHSGPTPTILGRKRFRGTVAANVIEFGTGGINIDECRVPTSEEDIDTLYRKPTKNNSNREIFQKNTSKIIGTMTEAYKLGRFPANVIHDGSDEVVSLFPIDSGGSKRSGFPGGKTFGGGDMKKEVIGHWFGDSGSASRFFNQINNRTELNQHLLKLLLPEQGTYIDITKEIK